MNMLEMRVILASKDYLKTGDNDIRVLCQNIVSVHGVHPSDEEIRSEVELFYNL